MMYTSAGPSGQHRYRCWPVRSGQGLQEVCLGCRSCQHATHQSNVATCRVTEVRLAACSNIYGQPAPSWSAFLSQRTHTNTQRPAHETPTVWIESAPVTGTPPSVPILDPRETSVTEEPKCLPYLWLPTSALVARQASQNLQDLCKTIALGTRTRFNIRYINI